MSDPRVCTKDEIDKNAAIAAKTGTQFGAVTVTITDRTEVSPGNWTIRFAVTGDRSGTIYTANWGDTKQMWAPCPSDIPCTATPDDPGPPPQIRDSGKLYFSAAYIAANRWSVRPKWPYELGGPHQPTKPLTIIPCTVEITGLEVASGRFVKATIELTDEDVAGSHQQIVLDGKSQVTLHLTPAGFAKFGLPF